MYTVKLSGGEMMTLGELIKIKRTETGISRNLLATKAGISHTEVQRSKLMKGRCLH
jgi:hypothetical protein